MIRFARSAVTAVAAAIAVAAVPGTGSASATAAAKPDCTSGFQAANHDGAVPMARHAGQKLDVWTPVKNLSGTSRTGQYQLQMDASGKWRTVPPTVWWRVDSGGWRLIHFTWAAGRAHSDPTWTSPNLNLGTFAPHQTRTLEISTSFVWNAHPGNYWGSENFSIAYCQQYGPLWYLGGSFVDFVYDPSR
jgi:hypothetical protein